MLLASFAFTALAQVQPIEDNIPVSKKYDIMNNRHVDEKASRNCELNTTEEHLAKRQSVKELRQSFILSIETVEPPDPDPRPHPKSES